MSVAWNSPIILLGIQQEISCRYVGRTRFTYNSSEISCKQV
ncbi:hypothetical protein H206_05134 [Candidatus Electrothrix aarhusensis]|uniref:Uncharacterized protein n=1 Tax=Candidatus Electrothrix aarhusensis TaxID=1859131 RepID=A0A3S3QIH2_9BACT|nr:hypothetical protein H206_05134 [Candidatus Electrothrix aarhusensis]